MPLEVLAAMVVVGIALVVGLVRLSGLSHPSHIESEEQARRILAADYPEMAPGAALITADRQAAFLDCGAAGVAMVHSFGSKFVTRRVEPGSLRRLETGADGRVTLQLADLTIPQMQLAFADSADRDLLVGWLHAERENHA